MLQTPVHDRARASCDCCVKNVASPDNEELRTSQPFFDANCRHLTPCHMQCSRVNDWACDLWGSGPVAPFLQGASRVSPPNPLCSEESQ